MVGTSLSPRLQGKAQACCHSCPHPGREGTEGTGSQPRLCCGPGPAQGSRGSCLPVSPARASPAPAPGLTRLLPICMAAGVQTHLLGCRARAVVAVRAPPSVGPPDPEDTAVSAVGLSAASSSSGRPDWAPLCPQDPRELLGSEEALTWPKSCASVWRPGHSSSLPMTCSGQMGTRGERLTCPTRGSCPQRRRSPGGEWGGCLPARLWAWSWRGTPGSEPKPHHSPV